MTELEIWLIRIIGFPSAVGVLILCERIINEMSKCVSLTLRIPIVLFAAGAAWQIIHMLEGNVPHWSSLIARVALLLLLIELRSCCRSCISLRPTQQHKLYDRRRSDHHVTANTSNGKG